MKTLITLSVSLLLSFSIFSQVRIVSSQGSPAPGYTTLKSAFDAINNGTVGGYIDILIDDNTTETATAVLYQSGYGSVSSYNSVSIYPTVSGKSISGNLNAPLIELNGADNVTIDGRVNATGSSKALTIINSSYSNAVAGTSNIRFINDASYNTVKFCTIKGSSAIVPGGVILFHTSSVTGNNYNNITDNDITNAADGYRPLYTIYSYSGGLPANSFNVVSRNNIYDFLSRSINSVGIYLYTQSGGWTISDNSFYETTTFAPTTSNTSCVININGMGSTTEPFTISGNYIGGSGPNCSGTWTKASNTYNNFTAISFSPTSTSATANEIQGNTIKNFSYSNTSVMSYAYFYGISIIGSSASVVNIGTSVPNVIGAATGTNSIVFTNSYSSGSTFYGMYFNTGAGTLTCKNNIVGSITVANSVAGNGTNFKGITKLSTGQNIISNNTIGSTSTSNSVVASSASTGNVQSVIGIEAIGNGPTTIESNTIANLSNNTTNATAATASSTIGIYATTGCNIINKNTIKNLSFSGSNNSATSPIALAGIIFSNVSITYNQTISRNTISGLTASYPDFAGQVAGIFYQSGVYVSAVESNFIHSISVTGASSTAATIYGVRVLSGSVNVLNNIISLGGNTTTTLYGITEPGSASRNSNFYNNTVNITGAPTAGSLNSYCVYSSLADNQRDFRNNILVNTRSNNGATGKHYLLYMNYASATNLTLDYNQYYSSGTGSVLAYFNSLDVSALPIVAGNDNSSQLLNPAFANTVGTNVSDYIASSAGTGVPINLVLLDQSDIIRNVVTPKMGALENGTNTSAVGVYSGATLLGNYMDLKAAFDKINDGTLTGNLEIKLSATQVLTSSAVLNASGSGAASYTAITIYPTVSGLMVTGNLPGIPLIDLNGADNVTIDGRVNASGSTKDLILVNTSNSSAGPTSTIRFINDASNNIVKYVVLKGAAMPSAFPNGMVIFGSTTLTTGNDQNLLDHCTFMNVSPDLRPGYTIYCSGTATKENNDITISNSLFENCLGAGGSAVFYVTTGNYNISIKGNSFYETLPLSPWTGVSYNYIYIYNNTGYGFDVSDNFFGGSEPLCQGSPSVKLGVNSNAFTVIYLTAGAGAASNIQGNTIRNISWTNSSTSALMMGIFSMGTTINIGTISGNTIGSLTGNGSITLTGTSTAGNSFIGISLSSPLVCDVRNNIIGSITLVNAATNASTFVGISKSSTNAGTFINNKIGGTTANSIDCNSTATNYQQNMTGISINNTGSNTITNNTIQNLTNRSTNANTATTGYTIGISIAGAGANTLSGNTIRSLSNANANNSIANAASVIGISLNAVTTAPVTISGNSITDLSNYYPSFTGAVTGMYISAGTAAVNTIEKNFVQGLSVSDGSTAASIYGLRIFVGNNNISNNILSLGYKNSSVVDGTIYGIYENGTAATTHNIYFNTISLGGNTSSGAANSYALYSNTNLHARDIRNNIFSNTRYNSGATGIHYAAYYNYATAGTLTMDFNDYYVSGNGTQLAYFNGSPVNALPIVAGVDASSITSQPGFTDPLGALVSDFILSANLTGTSISGITIDHLDNLRGTPPTVGALEYAASLAVKWLSAQAQMTSGGTRIDWQVSNESKGTVYTVQYSRNGAQWIDLGNVRAIGSNRSVTYTYYHSEPPIGKNFYRIVEKDVMGAWSYSRILIIDNNMTATSRFLLTNPVQNAVLSMQVQAPGICYVYNLNGQVVMMQTLPSGFQQLNVSALAKGTYVIKIGRQTAKVIIE